MTAIGTLTTLKNISIPAISVAYAEAGGGDAASELAV
jgi:hypothetical protein